MERNLYNFESVFNDINSILLSDSGKTYEKCKNVYTKVKAQYNVIDESFITHCNKYAAYLKFLEDTYKGNVYNIAKGIIYLYCWLYDEELHKQNYDNNRINIYKMLLEVYDEIEFPSNIPYIFRTYLNENIDENLKNLYDLYYKFDKFKNRKNCENNNCKCAEQCADLYNTYVREHCGIPYDNIFCNELQNFANIYNDYIDKNTHNCDKSKMILLWAGNRYIKVILTPILIIAIVSFIIFLLFKFTPFGSRLCFRSKNKKKKWNIVDEEIRDIRNPSKTFHSNSKAHPYTLGYHSMDHTP